MLTYRRTSLFESSAQTLVNTVNCVGVMGKGIAREFKDREPDMFSAYKRVCDQKLLAPGKLWLWRGTDFWTLNFPTKMHWRSPSKLEWVEAGLDKFVNSYEAAGIREISFPRLGCGNGGLEWDEVRPMMERYLSRLPIQIYIHDYTVDVGLPEHLEFVSKELRSEFSQEINFDTFVKLVRRAVVLSKNNLIDLSSNAKISATVTDAGDLEIATAEDSWIFETEDLWGVWIGLQKGLLTQANAGWSTTSGGRPLLSLLSLLPGLRPIEIQRFSDSEPEIAIEYKPGQRGSIVAPSQGKEQFEIPWY